MTTNILKYTLLTAIALVFFASCVSEDDFELPLYKQVIFSEGFESAPHGSGTNEIPVALEGWVNANLGTGERLWSVKQFSNNKFAEFSSFYSTSSQTDVAWLITPEIALENLSCSLSFNVQARFHNHDNLAVFISQDYDGTIEGITTANWQELNAYIPGSSDGNAFVPSGEIDLSDYIDTTIRIGYRYIGNKQANQTTTFQLDNVTIFEN